MKLRLQLGSLNQFRIPASSSRMPFTWSIYNAGQQGTAVQLLW